MKRSYAVDVTLRDDATSASSSIRSIYDLTFSLSNMELRWCRPSSGSSSVDLDIADSDDHPDRNGSVASSQRGVSVTEVRPSRSSLFWFSILDRCVIDRPRSLEQYHRIRVRDSLSLFCFLCFEDLDIVRGGASVVPTRIFVFTGSHREREGRRLLFGGW